MMWLGDQNFLGYQTSWIVGTNDRAKVVLLWALLPLIGPLVDRMVP